MIIFIFSNCHPSECVESGWLEEPDVSNTGKVVPLVGDKGLNQAGKEI